MTPATLTWASPRSCTRKSFPVASATAACVTKFSSDSTFGVWRPAAAGFVWVAFRPVLVSLVCGVQVFEVAADPETLTLLRQYSEREIEAGTGVHRSRIRLLRHGGTVTRKTYEKIPTIC